MVASFPQSREAGLPQSRAAGFVLTRSGAGGEPEYLLLLNRRDGMPGFPKGHRDGAEEDMETARRETREETGIVDLDVVPGFRDEIAYRVRKDGGFRWKTVVYFRARLRSGEVVLSHEHTAFQWLSLEDALARVTFPSLRDVLLRAAVHGKDPALVRVTPPDLAAADAHLVSLPHAERALVEHLRGGARLARAFADRLAACGVRVHPEAAATGTLLHDVGRALGRHEDHQLAGVAHLAATPFAAYSSACITHFTKGASREELLAASLPPAQVDAFEAAADATVFTWEEKCAALADSCMRGTTPTTPSDRFADVRRRYGPGAESIVALQEARTDAIRREMQGVMGRDPLSLVGLA